MFRAECESREAQKKDIRSADPLFLNMHAVGHLLSTPTCVNGLLLTM